MVSVEVFPATLRIVNRELTMRSSALDLSVQLRNINSLIVLGTFVEYFGGYPGEYHIRDLRTAIYALDKANADARLVKVARLRYESPLDIVLYGVGAGGGSAALWTVYRLYNKVLGAWKDLSDTRLHVTKNQAAIDAIKGEMSINRKKRTISEKVLDQVSDRIGPQRELNVILDQAVDAILDAEQIAIEDGPPRL